MFNSEGASTPINWKSSIDQVVIGYEQEPAKGLVHGLQKDAIQNAWGHKNNMKGKGWSCQFKLVENEKGLFLTIQDKGTSGMTGPNLSTKEINNLSNNLPPDYKLARFSSMNYSGENEGAGLFGRGKMLFSAASNNYSYFFESRTRQEGYRANWKMLKGNDLKMGEKALEGKEAERMIKESAGLEPITEIGSRIIIIDPKKEILDSIKNGLFMKYIEETWWRILHKYGAEITVEYDGKIKKSNIPNEYKEALNGTKHWTNWHKKIIQVPNYHRIKKIELFVSDKEIDEDLRGVYVYRKDMKIGEIPLEIPSKIQKKYFGYVEVENNWEKELAEIETLEHYGFTNKRKKAFQELKTIMNSEHEQFMELLGFRIKRKNENEILKKEMEEISNDLNHFFNKLELDTIGKKGIKKNPLDVRFVNIEFPNKDSHVVTNDIIKDIKFKIKNNTGMKREIKYILQIVSSNEVLKVVNQGTLEINGSEEKVFGPFNLIIKNPIARYEKNLIQLVVTRVNSDEKTVKEIPFYYDTTPTQQQGFEFNLKNESINFPNDGRRVDTNEKITNISYLIQNNTNSTAHIAFHISTHNPQNNNQLIEDILIKKDIVLNPHCEVVVNSPEIFLDKGIYEEHLSRGKLEIRAKISASKDFDKFELAELLTKISKISFNFNQDGDTGNSIFEDLYMIDEQNEKRKSVLSGDPRGWIFGLNIQHPSYLRVKDDDYARRDYIYDEMLKQTFMAFVKASNYSIFNLDGGHQNRNNNTDLSNEEFIEKLYSTWDSLQYDRYEVG